MMAMLVAGYMAKQKRADAAPSSTASVAPATPTGDMRGGILGGLRGGGAAGTQRTGATGGIASMLDMDGDGNVLDDILRMAGKTMR
jgi:predicted lipid-binding transport protein (Tim44 family)